jgi:hypothetical protein
MVRVTALPHVSSLPFIVRRPAPRLDQDWCLNHTAKGSELVPGGEISIASDAGARLLYHGPERDSGARGQRGAAG